MSAKLRLSRLSLSYWKSGDSLYAWTLTFLLTACTIIVVLLAMLLNKWQVEFYSQLQHYNLAGFTDILLKFIAIAAVYAFISGYQSYCRMSLEIRWRRWLTDKYIAMWLRDQTYCRLNAANPALNPDQRISEDIRLFIANTVELSVGLLRHSVMLLVFSVILWQLSGIVVVSLPNHNVAIPGYLLWLALLYSSLGTLFIIRAGRPLIRRNVLQQSNEADFRSCLTRINESDESVALSGGEKAEAARLAGHFQKIIHNYRQITKYTKTITFLSSGYSQLSMVFAFLIAAPRYFNQELQLGQLFEISGAYWYVHSALSYIIDSFDKIALWKAVAHRLDSFSLQMSAASHLNNSKGVTTFSHNHRLQLKNLTVFSPDNRLLLKSLSVELQPQDKLLISGPAGCGKTTLLRTIAGLWPYFSGSVMKPASQAIVFLPQKFYAPPGSLRDALLYPGQGIILSDSQLNELLECCNLSALSDNLDSSEDWGKILSLGERQCLAFARAILQRPDWLLLDEATTNLDQQTEQSLYRLLEKLMPTLTIVSGMRERLQPFHTLNLRLDGSGAWYIASLKKTGLYSVPKQHSQR